MVVDGMFYFLVYPAQASFKTLAFALRKMHGFHLRIVEKTKAFYLLGQRRAVNQIGMKHQPHRIGLGRIIRNIHLYQAAGGKTHHRTLLKVVLAAAVFKGAVRIVFQKQGIHLVLHIKMIEAARGVFKVDNRYQGVQGGQPVTLVVDIHRI